MKISQNKRLFLKNIHLIGYKSIKDLTIDIRNGLNIIIGKNGAGKSNFLQALHEGIGRMDYNQIAFQQASFTLNNAKGDAVLLDLEGLKNGVINAAINFEEVLSVGVKLYLNNVLIFDNLMIEAPQPGASYYPTIGNAIYKSNIGQWKRPVSIQYNLPHRLEVIDIPGVMTIPFEIGGTSWTIPNGTEFVAGLMMDFANHEDFRSIDRRTIDKLFVLERLIIDENVYNNLRKFTPIQDVRVNENINVYYDDEMVIVENLKLDFLVGGNWLPWSHLSDGTKRLFYIVTEVTANEGNLILIEEPELGVHPYQLDQLMTFLKEQSKYSQIIISTHSPKALDHLSENELDHILIAEYKKGSGTQLKRMSVEQKEKAKLYMKDVGYLSDYWLMSDLEE